MTLSKKPALRVILASASPRRRELLQLLGVEFEVRPSAVEESQLPGEPAEVFIARLAREKAEDVARRFAPLPENTVVLGCDTEVVLDGVPLGKPRNDGDASRMLHMLSGRAHEVLTGVCLIPGGEHLESTRVWFREMSESEIAEYVASGEPRDKAGAYAIQGRAARFIPRIEGCYYNVMGLPVAALYGRLREEVV
jgi:septum formation protein